jgi:hypothetical protein
MITTLAGMTIQECEPAAAGNLKVTTPEERIHKYCKLKGQKY